jgi:hypothetical protein
VILFVPRLFSSVTSFPRIHFRGSLLPHFGFFFAPEKTSATFLPLGTRKFREVLFTRIKKTFFAGLGSLLVAFPTVLLLFGDFSPKFPRNFPRKRFLPPCSFCVCAELLILLGFGRISLVFCDLQKSFGKFLGPFFRSAPCSSGSAGPSLSLLCGDPRLRA